MRGTKHELNKRLLQALINMTNLCNIYLSSSLWCSCYKHGLSFPMKCKSWIMLEGDFSGGRGGRRECKYSAVLICSLTCVLTHKMVSFVSHKKYFEQRVSDTTYFWIASNGDVILSHLHRCSTFSLIWNISIDNLLFRFLKHANNEDFFNLPKNNFTIRRLSYYQLQFSYHRIST